MNKKKKSNKTKTTDPKVVFRRSKVWQTFRTKLKKKQKVDPITGSPLVKGYNCHHRCFDPKEYTNIEDENRFVCLNNMSHEILHFVYGSGDHLKDWRKILKNIEEQCILMDIYNKEVENE